MATAKVIICKELQKHSPENHCLRTFRGEILKEDAVINDLYIKHQTHPRVYLCPGRSQVIQLKYHPQVILNSSMSVKSNHEY